jgi:starch-binding outer membrane protein, SusD/RagB family
MKINKIIKYSFYSVYTHFFIFCVAIFDLSCSKLIEVDPPIDEIVAPEIYKTDATAASVLTGIYTNMSSYGIFNGAASVSIRAGLSADELVPVTNASNILTILYFNGLTNNGDQLYWSDLYAYIFKANSAIEGISASGGVSIEVKKRLLAEAKFIRALMYFYLANFYGDVPLLTTTDQKINSIAPRTDKQYVYDRIITDLKDAQADLTDIYLSADIVTPASDRVRPNKYAATSLLARAYLFNGDWAHAEEEASKVISNKSVYKLESLENTFLKSSKEAIWQLQPVDLDQNTLDAEILVLAPSGGNPQGGPNDSKPVYLSRLLINDFSAGDLRKLSWIDSVGIAGTIYYYAYKYKAYVRQERTEYLMVFRLAEQYLIRAEARAQLGKIEGSNSAMEDINIIRGRAGLQDTAVNTKEEAVNLILNERRKELFTEWAHRWFDLKRTNKIDEVMSKVAISKGTAWDSYKSLYPIPVTDIQRNPSLMGHQNPGYPER